MKISKYFILALIIIVIDQASKLLVYKYMYLHQEINVIGEWFRLHYLLNPGMAFGIRWNNEFGKLALTAFRIAAMFGIGYYLWKMAQKNTHPGFLWCMALILGGAVGNLVDRTLYGYVLDFVDVYYRGIHFWAFNVADAAITVGAALVLIEVILAGRRHAPAAV